MSGERLELIVQGDTVSGESSNYEKGKREKRMGKGEGGRRKRKKEKERKNVIRKRL